MKRARQFVGLALLTSVACQSAAARNPLAGTTLAEYRARPAISLTGRVTDAAHILSLATQSELTIKLERFTRTTHHQLVIVTVPSLGGRNVADFARDLGNSWAFGRKAYNDGVILLVAPHEHRVRIAVGYGLERTLTNSVCQGIINEKIVPRFRIGDFAGGIKEGTDALIRHLS